MKTLRRAKKILRRFKHLTYIIIGLLGAILVFISCILIATDSDNVIYDLMMGVGCSIISTAFVTLVLLLILPDEDEDEDYAELKSWGITKIYEERRNTAFSVNETPKKQLDFIALGLKHFRAANGTGKGTGKNLIKNIQRGLHVRIITLHPLSIYVRRQEELENVDGLRSEIEELSRWVIEIQSMLGSNPRGSIEIRYYDNLPLHFYCRADSKIWVGPYLPGVTSNNILTYEFQAESKGGTLFDNTFQDYWDQNKKINIVDKDKKTILGDQKKAVESVLRYFADEMKGDDGDEVIGVVVIFKKEERLRRTLYSCNKPNSEKHNCYKIDEGAVGKLIEFNTATTRSMFFRDYANDISVTNNRQGRNCLVKKVDCSIVPFKKDSDMSAIVAAPIIIDNEMIGAVTFDFHKISTAYNADVNKLVYLEFDNDVDSSNILHKWFGMAETCADIIKSLLGDEIEISYKDLFGEEWHINDP